MNWLKDKTYFLCKYNTLKLEKRRLEKVYEKELKNRMFQIAELSDESEYYKEKYKLSNKRLKKYKERVKELEE